MIRLVAMMGVLLCTSGCVLAVADVKYVRSPNSLPPPGAVYVQTIDEGNADLAYGWLAMYGYEKAPSSGEAAYVVYLRELAEPIYTSCGEDPDDCGTVYWPQMEVLMERQIQGRGSTPGNLLVDITATGPVALPDQPFPPAAASYLLELAFAAFPGIEGTMKTLILRESGGLVCVSTAGGFLNPTIIHCRKPDAPPGVLTGASS